MKVAVDIRTNHRSGIYRYAISLLKTHSFWKTLNNHKTYFLYKDHRFKQDLESFLSQTRTSISEISFHHFSEHNSFLRRNPTVRKFLDDQGIDLYYSFHYLPDWRIEIPFIFTIYDLVRIKHSPFASYSDDQFFKAFGQEEFELMKRDLEELKNFIPSNFKPESDREIFSRFFYAASRYLAIRSQNIFTISESTKNDIVLLLEQPPQKVSVILGATDQDVFNTPGLIDCLPDNLTDKTKYCLFVGLLHERKRFPFLLQALAKVKDLIPRGSKLCVVGHHLSERPDMLEMISYYGINHFVEVIGEVSDQTLAELYRYACAVVIPSIEEGFCLPALEALSCGCEVIATDLPAIREVAGDHAHYFPNDDLESLAKLLQEAFDSNLPKRADKFVNYFSWEKSAEVLAKGLLSSLIQL
jgi:glycosyltransferase involved in cell wall biosynthesis